MELIDTHCHLTFEPLANDIEAVLARSLQADVSSWITIGTDYEHSNKSVQLAEEFENIYASVGVHPHDAKNVTLDSLADLKKLAQNKKVVAIGETGLDFHYNFSKPDVQRQIFREHIKIACELNMPLIIHSREAFGDTLKILDEFKNDIKKGVFHCFGYSAEQAKIILEKDFYISLTGVVTFKNAQSVRETAKLIPIDRLMIETDCPYMSPEPMRKQKVNEPAFMIHTAKFLADLKNMEFAKFAACVTANSKSFFSLA